VIDTSTPEYYKRTQRIFCKLYDAGLVYKDTLWVNRCPWCQTVLANDQVVDGKCERCKSEITQKKHPQWFIKITDYADRLLEDLDTIDRPEETKTAQRNWIGRSEGAEIDFAIRHPERSWSETKWAVEGSHEDTNQTKITCFTTRIDTVYGVTAVVLAPENTLLDDMLSSEKRIEVETYRQDTLAKTAVQRQKDLKEKTWVPSAIYVVHPLTGEDIEVWYADYVLADYGTGAVMMVPAHDERDAEFAKKYGVEVKQVINWKNKDKEFTNSWTWKLLLTKIFMSDKDISEKTFWKEFEWKEREIKINCYAWEWTLINSSQFDWLDSQEAKSKIAEHLESIWAGRKKVTYKLRDRSVSRQRYWGSPVPVYYDENGDHHLVPESELPVALPLDLENYQPTWKSPLEDHPTFPTYIPSTNSWKKIKTALLIHGRGNSSSDAWCLAWVQRTLQAQWVKVIFPDFTYHVDYDFDKTMSELLGYDADMVVGHSAGGFLAMHWASEKKPKEIVLVAPTSQADAFDDVFNTDIIDRLGPDNAEKYTTFHSNEINFDWLKDKDIKVYYGSNDTIMLQWNKAWYDLMKPMVLSWRWHMWSDEDTDSIGEINTYISHLISSKDHIYRQENGTIRYQFAKTCKHYPNPNFDDKQARTVSCVIIHPDREQVLMIQHAWVDKYMLAGWWIDLDETPIETAMRECREETWYFDFEVVEQLWNGIWVDFAHRSKWVNYLNTDYPVYLQLTSLDQKEVDSSESNRITCSRISMNEISIKMWRWSHAISWNRYIHKDAPDMDAVDDAYIEQCNARGQGKPLSLQNNTTYTRECDTLDTFMCSSFYFLRFPNTGNSEELVRKELADKMFPVDFYSGGKEHTVGHLLYSRFIHKFLYDQWYLPSAEPFKKLIHQGMVLGADGRKMWKRYGNWVDPIVVVDTFGADAVRTYLMFMWPVESDKPWNDASLKGVQKFITKVKKLLTVEWRWTYSEKVDSLMHETIKGITYDIENLKLNTVVSKYMILLNAINDAKAITDEQLKIFALLLAPFATDVAQEIWEDLGQTWSIHSGEAVWPVADETKIVVSSITLPIQINGKVRAKIDILAWLSEDEVMKLAHGNEIVQKYTEDKQVRKIIWIQDKILNIIVG